MRLIVCLVILSVLGSFTGCGGPFPVKMTFTLDGKPLDAAGVSLVPDNSQTEQHPANGKTGTDGTVTFKSGTGDGVYAGKYTVTLTKQTEDWGKNGKPSDEKIAALKAKGINVKPHTVSIVPEKYTKADWSDLKIEISYFSDKEFTFDLQNRKAAAKKQPAETEK
ncbi:MAG: hypothetical protein LBT89_08340 [Planctomycetaceae bacterium]|nr:hypothetical protein [Planctomycetaceae bacterium]